MYIVDFFLNIILTIFNQLFWWPWFSFFNDVYIFQFIFIFTLYNFFCSKNIFYLILYLFLQILNFGIFLCFFQVELFCGFLWIVEFTVIFISMLLLFFLNVEGNLNNLYLKFNKIFFFFFFILFLFFMFIKLNSYFEDFYLNWVNSIFLWIDYYEGLNNCLMNDFLVLSISYYFLNGFEFLLLGFILFLGSLICVIINKYQKNIKISGLSSFFNIFDFFNDYINFIFLRKQNLNSQSRQEAGLRFFKKKKW